MPRLQIPIEPLLKTEFANTLQTMRADRDPRLSMTLRVAWGDGWPKPILAKILGVTRQRVQQMVRYAEFWPVDELPPIPPPPERPKPQPKGRAAIPWPTPEEEAELRELYTLARYVRGTTPLDHPGRRASAEFTARAAALIEKRVPRSYVAAIVGCSPQGLALRLARHGYSTAPSYERLSRPFLYKNIDIHQETRDRPCDTSIDT